MSLNKAVETLMKEDCKHEIFNDKFLRVEKGPLIKI